MQGFPAGRESHSGCWVPVAELDELCLLSVASHNRAELRHIDRAYLVLFLGSPWQVPTGPKICISLLTAPWFTELLALAEQKIGIFYLVIPRATHDTPPMRTKAETAQ